jgi:hypothetical protein
VVNLISEATTFEEAIESGKWLNLTFIFGKMTKWKMSSTTCSRTLAWPGKVPIYAAVVWLDVPVLLGKESVVCVLVLLVFVFTSS